MAEKITKLNDNELKIEIPEIIITSKAQIEANIAEYQAKVQYYEEMLKKFD